jgi:hypothetical protein
LTVGVDKLKGDFGDAFLPALTKLFKGLAPYIEKFANTIKANTPQLEKWADVIVTKILEQLPRLFREFQRLVPRGLKAIEGFAKSIGDVGKEADGLLGPGGSITLLVTGIGAAFGGLKGAITANLVKGGMDPCTAIIVANIAAQIPASLASALTSAIVNQAIAAYGAKMAAATVATNAIPGTTPGGGGGFNPLGFLGTAFGSVAATIGGLFAVQQVQNAAQTQALEAYAKGETPLWQKLITPWLWPELFSSGSTPTSGIPAFSGGTSDPMTAKYTSNIYIGTGKVDTVVSESIDRLRAQGRNY